MRNILTIIVFLAIVSGGVNLAASSAGAQTPPAAAAQTAPATNPAAPVTPKTKAADTTPAVNTAATAAKTFGESWKALTPDQRTSAAITGVAILFLTLVIFGLGSRTEILRGAYPVDFGGAVQPDGTAYRRPFSLAQCQMMWWFILVLVCYLLILWTTGVYNSITTQVLTLMGIGTGTALGAAMIDQTKSTPNQDAFIAAVQAIRKFEKAFPTQAQAVAAAMAADTDAAKALDEINSDPNATAAQKAAAATAKTAADTDLNAALAAGETTQAGIKTAYTVRDQIAPKLASEDFFTDILTDVSGISLHRFQSLAWTLVLGGVFVAEVAVQGKFPEFEATELALLGIASGVYLGFKVPEQSS